MKEKFIRLTGPRGDLTVVRADQIQCMTALEDGGTRVFMIGDRIEECFSVQESPSQIIELMEGA